MRFSSQTIFNEILFISMSRLHNNGNSVHACCLCQISTSSESETLSESKVSLSDSMVASTTSAACSTPSSMALVIHAFLNPQETTDRKYRIFTNKKEH